MLKLCLLVLAFQFPLHSIATEKKEHREHGAHSHGSAQLAIAFDGKIGKLEFRSPAESIVGFEYKAKSPKDKKQQADSLKKFGEKISEMLVFETALGCVATPSLVTVNDSKGGHSDFVADFTVACAKSIEGSKILFRVQKYFPKLQDIDVQIIVGNLQKSLEVKNDGTEIELK